MESFLGNRFEIKYLVDLVTAKKIESYFKKIGLVSDVHSKKGSYVVNSLYYDTPLLDDYREKDASLLVRRKMRARIYNESWFDDFDRVWFEIKKKRNMNISKVRFGVDRGIWDNFVGTGDINELYGGRSVSEDLNELDEFSYIYKRRLYRPHVVVSYKRSAYLSNFLSLVRITFDKEIKACRFEDWEDKRFMTTVLGDKIVLELKYNGKVPWWFTEVVKRFDLQRTDFSKYRNSVAMLRGYYQIPINK